MSEGNDTRSAVDERELLERLVSNAPLPLAVVEGPEFRYVLVNRAYCAIEARTETFFLGRTIAQIFPEGVEHDARMKTLQEAYTTGRCTDHKELEFNLRPGRERTWWNIELVPLRKDTGQVYAVLIMAQDVTAQVLDRRRLEEQAAALRESEEQLKRLTQTLEQRVVERTAIAEQRTAQLRVLAAELTQAEERERRRVAKVLHDHLQQLLVAARMKIALLHRRAEEERLSRTLEQIDDVLNQALTESRSLTVELSPPVLYDAGLTIGLQWLARQMKEKYGLHVIVNAAPQAEPCEESMRVFLFQAVRELLLNVVKHAKTDAARVDLRLLPDDQLQLVVADRGAGFDLASLNARSMPGGFGLFSIRERLELQDGHLTVETAPRQGTRVVIEVPLARRPLPSADLPTESLEPAIVAAHAQEERPVPAEWEKIRVMLADDHAIVRQGLAGLLREHAAIEVVGEAADGHQAVEIAISTRPDVVLMDVTMPVLNGIEATRRILSVLPDVRVIGLSMHEAADMASAMRRAGAIAYLRKDTDTDLLVSTIHAQRHSQRPLSQ
jgi:PAS domain S-box-containing protein